MVTPYQGQVQMLKQHLSDTDIFDTLDYAESVRTIDSWQGRECGVVIISTVRSNEAKKMGFLKKLRRLNVALTRAQHGLIVVGNADTL